MIQKSKIWMVSVFLLIVIVHSPVEANSFDLVFSSKNLQAPIQSLTFSESGTLLVSGNMIGTLEFWDFKSKEKLKQFSFEKFNRPYETTSQKAKQFYEKHLGFNAEIPAIKSLARTNENKNQLAVAYDGVVGEDDVKLINLVLLDLVWVATRPT